MIWTSLSKSEIKKLMLEQAHKHQLLLVAFVFLIISTFIFTDKAEPTPLAASSTAPDTIIPAGYVLVPLDFANYESLNAMIQKFGVVDLYVSQFQSQMSRKIASKVKILRAPYNSQQFAVLVPEAMSEKIMKETGPFLAVVQNRKLADEAKYVQRTKIKPIQIEYQRGEQ